MQTVNEMLHAIGLNISGVVFLSLAGTCMILSAFMIYQEIGEINRKLPEDEQIPYMFMYPQKMARIKNEYKRLYPNGKVEYWRFGFQIAGFVFLALTVIAGGFFN